VTVRYWAGAQRAAGLEREELTAATVGELRDLLGARPSLAKVSVVASFLVDGQQAGDTTTLHDGAEVDVLPPFAGG
jgi:molybdopterin synthase sulfur carrier subunit